MQTTQPFTRIRISRHALLLRRKQKGSETVLLELIVESRDGTILESLLAGCIFLLLEFIILGGFGLSLVLEFGNKVLFGPASRLCEISEATVVSVSLHS